MSENAVLFSWNMKYKFYFPWILKGPIYFPCSKHDLDHPFTTLYTMKHFLIKCCKTKATGITLVNNKGWRQFIGSVSTPNQYMHSVPDKWGVLGQEPRQDQLQNPTN